MNQQLPRLTFEQSKRAYSLGFDWRTKARYFEKEDNTFEFYEDAQYVFDRMGVYEYLDDYSAPENATFLQWARDVMGVHGWTEPNGIKWRYCWHGVADGWNMKGRFEFETYLEAESALIDELLTVLENDNKNN